MRTTWLSTALGIALLSAAALPALAETAPQSAARHREPAITPTTQDQGMRHERVRQADRGTCQSMISYFDDNAAHHKQSSNYAKAERLRDQAEQACGKGDYSGGVKQLHAAERLLGIPRG